MELNELTSEIQETILHQLMNHFVYRQCKNQKDGAIADAKNRTWKFTQISHSQKCIDGTLKGERLFFRVFL